MTFPQELADMRELQSDDGDAVYWLSDGGGLWLDSADLNRLLLQNGMVGLESMGGKPNLDELTERCPKDDVDLILIEGGERNDPVSYCYCEVCGGIWIDLELDPEAELQAIPPAVVEFFQRFHVPPNARVMGP